jgi:hypothetical protein
VRKLALHAGGDVGKPLADVHAVDLAIEAVVGIEIGLVMRPNEERGLHRSSASFALAEHDVGAHREALRVAIGAAELGAVEIAVQVVTEVEVGVARFVVQHVGCEHVDRHERRRLRRGSHERGRRVR